VTAHRRDPLPSWNEGWAKAAILDFIARATEPGGEDFVPSPTGITVVSMKEDWRVVFRSRGDGHGAPYAGSARTHTVET
jgi:hypothetical protein